MEDFIRDNFDIFYYLTLVMLAVASVVIIAFSILQMISNKKAAVKTLLTTGGLFVVLSISYYVLASDDVLTSYNKYNIDSDTSNWVGMGIWSFYLLSGFAVLAIIYSEFSKKFIK